MIFRLIKWAAIPLIGLAIFIGFIQYVAMHIFHWNFIDSLLQGLKEIIKIIMERM